VQSRSKWFLGAGVLAIVLGGVLLLWALSNSASVRSLWHGHGATVLQFAVPPVLALLGWTAQQLITSRSERSTPEQLMQARLALAGRGLEWWRGVPEPAWPGHVLRAGRRRQAELGRFATAIALGIPFGVLWGATAVLKHQHGLVVSRLHGHVHIISMPPSHQQVIITGLITGIDFVLGAWLFHWSAPWFQPRRPATPRPAARADLAGALLRPFILGFAFAFAFGISAPFNFTGVDVAAWFVVGTVLGTLGTEWPLYLTAISWLALRRKELPLRLLRFLDCCRACGILRVIHHEYQIHDAALLAGAEPAAREPAAGPQRGLRIDVPRQTSGLVAAAGHPMSDDGQG
jgi:hypothetical protein